MSETEFTKLHLSLSPDELGMLKQIAHESHRSMSGQLRHMITERAEAMNHHTQEEAYRNDEKRS